MTWFSRNMYCVANCLNSWHWRTSVWYGNGDPCAWNRNEIAYVKHLIALCINNMHACVSLQTNWKLFFNFINKKSVCVLSSHIFLFSLYILLAFQAAYNVHCTLDWSCRRKCTPVSLYTHGHIVRSVLTQFFSQMGM